MTWIALIGLIITVLTKLPALIELIQKWLEVFKRVPKSAHWRERGAFGRSLRAALARSEQLALTGYSDVPHCPVAAHVAAMELAYPQAA